MCFLHIPFLCLLNLVRQILQLVMSHKKVASLSELVITVCLYVISIFKNTMLPVFFLSLSLFLSFSLSLKEIRVRSEVPQVK